MSTDGLGRGRSRGDGRGGGGRGDGTPRGSSEGGRAGGGRRGGGRGGGGRYSQTPLRGGPQNRGGGSGIRLHGSDPELMDPHQTLDGIVKVRTTNWDGQKFGVKVDKFAPIPPIHLFGYADQPTASPDAAVRKIEDELVNTLGKGMNRMNLQDKHLLPRRPGYNTQGPEVKVYANYFPVKVKDDVTIYKYNVKFTGTAPSQAKKGRLVELVASSPELELEGKIPYRTNFRDIIVTTQKIPSLGGKNHRDITVPYTPEWQGQLADSDAQASAGRDYTARVTFDFDFNLGKVVAALNTASELPSNYEAIVQTLNAMFSHNPYKREDTIAVIAKTELNKYFDSSRDVQNEFYNATFTSLGLGMEAMRGFIKSVRLGTGRILLNVNVATSVFVQPVSLVYYFNNVIKQLPWKKWEGRIKTLRIGRLHLQKKLKNGKPLMPPASIWGFAHKGDGSGRTNKPRFNSDGIKEGSYPNAKQVQFHLTPPPRSTLIEGYISVYDYFTRQYPKLPISDTLPVVNIGSTSHPSYIPMEVAVILPGNQMKGKLNTKQAQIMVDFACRRPKQNAEAIQNEGRRILGLDSPQNAVIEKLGIIVSDKMVVVNARVLNAPKIQYGVGKKSSVLVNNGSWNMADARFQTPKAIGKWTYIIIKNENGFPEDDTKLHPVVMKFYEHLKLNTGMTVGPPTNLTGAPGAPPTVLSYYRDGENIYRAFERLKGFCVQWVLVILGSVSTTTYRHVKSAGDIQTGLHTVCVTADKFGKQDIQYFGNVALKFNLKAGGINHTLPPGSLGFIEQEKTMIVGLDVTHPSSASANTAMSVASMVASVDGKLNQWPGVISVQKPAFPGSAREMVDELEEMLKSRLRLWARKHNRVLPENILVYRDGISEGQLELCLAQELPRLQNACRATEFGQYVKAPPRFTIVVCSKRHHTRFFPSDPSKTTASLNCQAGTCVDRDVTAPHFWEFFLQAHHCIQGTAKSCRYIVIKDDIFKDRKLVTNPANLLPFITNNMCHLFGRATKAVSLCPPAYYADILCERARAYLHDHFEGDGNGKADEDDVSVDGRKVEVMNDFKLVDWEKLSPAKKQHYQVKGQNLRDEQQTLVAIHVDLKDTMFYV